MTTPRDPFKSISGSLKRLSLLPALVTYGLLGLWTLVCLFPLYWMATTSLKGESRDHAGAILSAVRGFCADASSWQFILFDTNDSITLRFFNSLSVGLIATVLTLLLGSMVVYGVTRFGGRGRAPLGAHGLLLAILVTRLLPPAVVVLPLYILATTTGIVDTRFALIITYTAINLPVAVWLLRPVIGNVATEQEEAAQLDGASRFAIFFTIFLPMIVTSLAAVGLLIFIQCWNEYLFSVYLATNQAQTLPPFLVGQMSLKEAQVGGEATEIAQLSAAAVVMVVPMLAVTGLAQKFLGRLTVWQR